MPPTRIVLVLFVLLVASVHSAAAQVVTAPAFPVASDAVQVDVTATYSGTYFLRRITGGPQLYLQRFADGTFGPSVTVNHEGGVSSPRIAARESSGMTATWLFGSEIWIRYLDTAARPTGSPLQLSSDDGFTNGSPRIAATAAGAAIVWSESKDGIRLFIQIGAQRYEPDPPAIEWEVASTPDGGCLVAWHTGAQGEAPMVAWRFDAAGLPVGSPVDLAAGEMTLTNVAVAPDGTAVIVGVRLVGIQFELWASRFAPDGSPLGPDFLVGTTYAGAGQRPDSGFPAVAFDYAGNLYVVWGNESAPTSGVFARGFRPDGAPFGPPVQLSADKPRNAVRTTRLPNGQFANVWTTGTTAYSNVVTLCAPGQATCGDGVHVPACERCDDGAGNDDAAPNACRTSCLPAHCGDGVIDAGEQCDDGNFASCDGCTPDCTIEVGNACGDGVAACGEQCDDGNLAALDGCTPACTLEPILGGGPPRVDCFSVWTIENPTTEPPYDKTGAINGKQRCVDGDPRCDFDGGVVGSCTFRVRGCGNATGIAGCGAAGRLSTWLVHTPSEKQAAKKPWLAAVRTTLQGTVPGAIVGPVEWNVCSIPVAVTVPLRGTPGRYKAGKLVIKTRATSYEGEVDKDILSLECVPPS